MRRAPTATRVAGSSHSPRAAPLRHPGPPPSLGSAARDSPPHRPRPRRRHHSHPRRRRRRRRCRRRCRHRQQRGWVRSEARVRPAACGAGARAQPRGGRATTRLGGSRRTHRLARHGGGGGRQVGAEEAGAGALCGGGGARRGRQRRTWSRCLEEMRGWRWWPWPRSRPGGAQLQQQHARRRVRRGLASHLVRVCSKVRRCSQVRVCAMVRGGLASHPAL